MIRKLGQAKNSTFVGTFDQGKQWLTKSQSTDAILWIILLIVSCYFNVSKEIFLHSQYWSMIFVTTEWTNEWDQTFSCQTMFSFIYPVFCSIHLQYSVFLLMWYDEFEYIVIFASSIRMRRIFSMKNFSFWINLWKKNQNNKKMIRYEWVHRLLN